MPRNEAIQKVLVIGSGPIVIGQAAEFDYAGTQACRSLKEEGIEVVLLNSNPATIMTDQNIADHVYIEPLTAETVKQLILKEHPDSILPTLGGQAALNLAMELEEDGFLREHQVKLIGTTSETIKKADKVPLMCGGTGDVWATGEPYWICVGNGALLSEYPEFNKQLEEGTVQFNNPVTVEVLTAWQDMINKGYYYKGAMSLGYPQAAEEFQKGTSVMMMDGSWVAAAMDAEGKDNIGVFAVPLMDGSKTYTANYIYWGVSEASEHKDIAFDFIRYICEENPEIYRAYLKADGLYSSTKTAVTYEQGPLMTKFMENISGWEPATEIFYEVGEYAMPSGVASFVCKSFQNIFNGADVSSETVSWDAEYQRLLEAQ